MANPPFIILSCDGGGVRGVITAKLLQSLDPAFLQSVSLFAGTSTGSIIALGLAAGVPIGTIVSLYESMSNCNEIFTPYLNQAQSRALRAQIAAAIPPQTAAAGEEIDWSKILQLVMEAAEQMAFPKYQSTGLQTLLTANFPAMTLAQLATQRQKYVIVPSFRISPGQNNAWAACVFHNLPGLTTTPDLSATSLIDTAMCSAAAPLFFPPQTIAPGSFVDGGVCANNPCTVAAACYSGSSLSGANGPHRQCRRRLPRDRRRQQLLSAIRCCLPWRYSWVDVAIPGWNLARFSADRGDVRRQQPDQRSDRADDAAGIDLHSRQSRVHPDLFAG